MQFLTPAAGIPAGGGVARKRGFTLVELLLTVTLICLFLGAMVCNFSDFGKNARFDEGVGRMEALLRLAQAQAASSGRVVQMVIEASMDTNSLDAVGVIRIRWEPDPLAMPGVFEDLSGDQWQTAPITDLVRIESVTNLAGNLGHIGSPVSSGEQMTFVLEDSTSGEPTCLTFYPDGSCDPAEITLAPREASDLRRTLLRLNGVTGAIQRQSIALEDQESWDETYGQEPVSTSANSQKGRPDSNPGGDRTPTITDAPPPAAPSTN